jgi:hypothetical protein
VLVYLLTKLRQYDIRIMSKEPAYACWATDFKNSSLDKNAPSFVIRSLSSFFQSNNPVSLQAFLILAVICLHLTILYF